MALTQAQIHQIVEIDRKVKSVLQISRDEEILLVEMLELMPANPSLSRRANRKWTCT